MGGSGTALQGASTTTPMMLIGLAVLAYLALRK